MCVCVCVCVCMFMLNGNKKLHQVLDGILLNIFQSWMCNRVTIKAIAISVTIAALRELLKGVYKKRPESDLTFYQVD